MTYQSAVIKILCVAVIACIVLPLGRAVFPYVADFMDHMSFSAVEAVLSAVGGWGIYVALFG